MLEWLKSAWASWRVRITVVGGTLVVATAYGTCSFDPQEVSEVQVEPETEQVGENTANTVPVTETTTTTTENVENGGEVATETNATEQLQPLADRCKVCRFFLTFGQPYVNIDYTVQEGQWPEKQNQKQVVLIYKT